MHILSLAARRVIVTLLACAASLTFIPSAAAGEYRYFACQLPTGAPLSIGDWSMEYNIVGSGFNGCADQGFMYIPLGPPQTGTDYWTGVGITLPGGLRATSIRANRWVRLQPGGAADINATPSYSLRWGLGARWTENGTTALESCQLASPCGGMGWPGITPGPSGVEFAIPGAGASFIGFAAACVQWGPPSGACMFGEGGRVHLRINYLDLTVKDDTNPTISSSSGTLLQPSTRSGTETLSFAAHDAGAGVYQAILRVDGVEVDRISPDSSPACVDAGGLSSTELEFTRLQPCPVSAGLAFSVDTTRLSNGKHRVTAFVRDAAGNLSNQISQDVVIDNPAPAPSPSPSPSPSRAPGGDRNGSGGDPSTGQLGLARETRRISAKYGATRIITGKLVDATGTPIAGANIDVSERVDVPGVDWSPAGSIKTDAKGSYAFRPKTTASRRLRFSFAPAVSGTPYRSSREVFVSVRAKLTIKTTTGVVARRGLIKLSGRVQLDAIPKKGAWIEIQALQGKAWRTIGSRRASAKGGWEFRHRLKTAANTTLWFRSRLRPASDLPSAEATSRKVGVRVR